MSLVVCRTCMHVWSQRLAWKIARIVPLSKDWPGRWSWTQRLACNVAGRKYWPVRSRADVLGRKDWPVRSPQGGLGRKDRPVRSPEGGLGRKGRPARSSKAAKAWNVACSSWAGPAGKAESAEAPRPDRVFFNYVYIYIYIT